MRQLVLLHTEPYTTDPNDRSNQEKLGAVREDRNPLAMKETRSNQTTTHNKPVPLTHNETIDPLLAVMVSNP